MDDAGRAGSGDRMDRKADGRGAPRACGAGPADAADGADGTGPADGNDRAGRAGGAAYPAAVPAPARPSAESTRTTCLRGEPVVYRLRHARRRSIGFVVGADGLTVAAPRWIGAGQIEAALHAKAGWVLRKLAEQRERAARLEASRIEWRDGATLPFLGRTVRVTLDGRATGAVLDAAGCSAGPAGGSADAGATAATLRIGLPADAAPAQIRDAVHGWLQRQARRVFEERCAHYAPRLGVRPRRLSLTSARTRWGSASADGSVRLNWRLVHFALPTIDYVVAHELAHLRHMDHGPQFWAVVRTVVPDVEGAREMLRGAVLLGFE